MYIVQYLLSAYHIFYKNVVYLSKVCPILVRNLWIWPLTCPSKSLMGGRKRNTESRNRLNMQENKISKLRINFSKQRFSYKISFYIMQNKHRKLSVSFYVFSFIKTKLETFTNFFFFTKIIKVCCIK